MISDKSIWYGKVLNYFRHFFNDAGSPIKREPTSAISDIGSGEPSLTSFRFF